MRLTTPLFVVGISLSLACGATKSGDTRNGQVTDGGSAGARSEPVSGPCSAANAFPIWGKPYDAERDCIDTEHPVEGVACTLQPREGDDPYYSDGFVCLQSKTDGESVWVFAFNRVGFDEAIWQRCPDAPLIAPKGCYAAGCPSAPRSTCSLAETSKMYSCGPNSEYDENCCGRPPCETDGDCADNQTCAEFMTLGQWYCWDNPGNSCDGGGPQFGAPRHGCIAK